MTVTVEVPEKAVTRKIFFDPAADPDKVAQEMADELGLKGTYIFRLKGSFKIEDGSVLELVPMGTRKDWGWADS